MATKAISKMNKKELYTLCQEQKAEIQNTRHCRDTAAARRVTRGGEKTNEIKMLHEVIADYKLQNEKLIEENKELNKRKSIKWSRDFAWPLINKLKEENEKLKEETDRAEHYKYCYETADKAHDSKARRLEELIIKKSELQEEVEELKKQNEKKQQELVKMTNDHQIAHMLLMEEYITKDIEKVIDEGDDQYSIACGTNFYKEYKLKYIEEHIIPYLTIHNEEKDDTCSSYKNGNYYYAGDCMMPYEFQYADGTMLFNRVETDEEDFEYGEDDDDWEDGAGFKYFKKEKEYVIYMCGGCAEWWNYVLTPQGIYKEDTHGREKQDQDLWCCPGGTYLSLQDKDYEPREGESRMWEVCDEGWFNEEYSDDECDSDSDSDSEDE